MFAQCQIEIFKNEWTHTSKSIRAGREKHEMDKIVCTSQIISSRSYLACDYKFKNRRKDTAPTVSCTIDLDITLEIKSFVVR
jgi:hypothetical protein